MEQTRGTMALGETHIIRGKRSATRSRRSSFMSEGDRTRPQMNGPTELSRRIALAAIWTADCATLP